MAEAEQAEARSLGLCGQAANAVELAGRFDAVFLLEIDQQTMAARMQRPERGNDIGPVGDSLDPALAGDLPFGGRWRRFAARSVDAIRDVATVAENLLLTAALAVQPSLVANRAHTAPRAW